MNTLIIAIESNKTDEARQAAALLAIAHIPHELPGCRTKKGLLGYKQEGVLIEYDRVVDLVLGCQWRTLLAKFGKCETVDQYFAAVRPQRPKYRRKLKTEATQDNPYGDRTFKGLWQHYGTNTAELLDCGSPDKAADFDLDLEIDFGPDATIATKRILEAREKLSGPALRLFEHLLTKGGFTRNGKLDVKRKSAIEDKQAFKVIRQSTSLASVMRVHINSITKYLKQIREALYCG